MGTWGPDLFQDDIALDVRGDFEAAVDEGAKPGAAADRVLVEYQDVVNDMDEGPVVMLALAALLMERGVTEHTVLDQAERVLAEQAGLERWEDAGGEALAERKAVYQDLAHRLSARRG
jgi:hypothetical protein